ncbi:hypothetical protein F66182_18769, partial [Fusarium sp. NRRL 66182]
MPDPEPQPANILAQHLRQTLLVMFAKQCTSPKHIIPLIKRKNTEIRIRDITRQINLGLKTDFFSLTCRDKAHMLHIHPIPQLQLPGFDLRGTIPAHENRVPYNDCRRHSSRFTDPVILI